MKKLILCLAVMMLSVVGAIAQTKDGGISEDMLSRIRQTKNKFFHVSII